MTYGWGDDKTIVIAVHVDQDGKFVKCWPALMSEDIDKTKDYCERANKAAKWMLENGGFVSAVDCRCTHILPSHDVYYEYYECPK